MQVATFTSTYTNYSASDFTAFIDWGDGSQSIGTVSGSGGSFTVNDTPTYTNGGNQPLTVTVTDDGVFATASATGHATASINLDRHLVLTSATEHTALANTMSVATFSDSNLTDTAGSFSATIDWGDGVTTAGSVVGAAGSFTVQGGHTYTEEGSDTASITLTRTPTIRLRRWAGSSRLLKPTASPALVQPSTPLQTAPSAARSRPSRTAIPQTRRAISLQDRLG